MKKFLAFLSVLLISLGAMAQYTVTVSGEVVAIESGEPLPGIEVTIMNLQNEDSTTVITTFTNEAGEYNASFEAVGEGGIASVSVFDCEDDEVQQVLNYTYEQTELVADFEICSEEEESCESDFEAINLGALTMFFYAESEAPNPEFTWEFGDGTGASGEAVEHTFASEGTYEVTLTTTDETVPCESSVSYEIYVSDSSNMECEAFFTYEIESEEDSLTLVFEDESFGDPDSWEWYVGEQLIGDEEEITYTFEESGLYTVCLVIANDDTGCEDEFCQEVFVGDFDNPCLSEVGIESIEGLTVNFEAINENEGLEFDWEFGDGNTGSGRFVEHTYEAEGLYEVLLTTYDENSGCESEAFGVVYVGDSNFVDCEAYFSYEYLDDEDPYTYVFEDESYGDPTSYEWYLGEQLIGDDSEVIYTFGEQGVYEVCLVIYNDSTGCEDTYCEEIFVGEDGNPCETEIEIDEIEGLTVTLGAEYESEGLDFFWEFGDGTEGTGEEVTHTYAEAGEYEVTLISTLENVCESETSLIIFVDDSTNTGCQAFFSYTVYEDNTVAFDEASYGNPESYFWEFGDGTSSEEQNPAHFYPEDGVYEVCLTIESDDCESTYCQEVTVGNAGGEVYAVYGSVFAGSQQLDNGLALLMGTENNYYNTDVVDSAGIYNFGEVPAGTYYIQAMPLPQSQFIGEYLPTYYGNTIFWDDAIEITVGEDENPLDISLVEIGDLVNGPGNILGTLISQLKSTDVSDVDIYLLDKNQNPIAHTKTDENGDFSFGDIALDGYYLRVEIMGLNADPIAINLSEEDASPEIELILKDGGVLLDVDEPQLPASLNQIYPNPVQNLLRLEVSALKNTKVELNVVNQLGQIVLSESHELQEGSKTLDVNTAILPKGLHSLVITTEDGQRLVKKFVKK